MDGSAMGVFTSREAAEEFVSGDPFVLHGVVRSRRIRQWDELLAEPDNQSISGAPATLERPHQSEAARNR
jgi:hypothetical protein